MTALASQTTLLSLADRTCVTLSATVTCHGVKSRTCTSFARGIRCHSAGRFPSDLSRSAGSLSAAGMFAVYRARRIRSITLDWWRADLPKSPLCLHDIIILCNPLASVPAINGH